MPQVFFSFVMKVIGGKNNVYRVIVRISLDDLCMIENSVLTRANDGIWR